MVILNCLKILSWFIRKFTKSSATALPGLILEQYFPKTFSRLFLKLNKVVLITGTNGKTTTARMVADILEKNGVRFITNLSGSNMLRGIATVLMQDTDFSGNAQNTLAVFEVEEGTMPKLTKYLKADLIVATNIFRDQLDAYGEIDKTLQYISDAIVQSPNADLILNFDDQRVRSLERKAGKSVTFLGFNEDLQKHFKFENKDNSSVDVKGNKIRSDFMITDIKIDNDLHTTFSYTDHKKTYKSKIIVPGLHNAFNALCAIEICKFLDKDKTFDYSLDKFQPVFGRGEIVEINNTKFQILLVKNPAGMNLNLDLLTNSSDRNAILFILNDNIADGRDVSWIWDSNIEKLSELKFNNIYCAGERRFDMALRVEYSGNKTKVFESIEQGIEQLLTKGYKKVFILPTYTSMLGLREVLGNYVEIDKMYK